MFSRPRDTSDNAAPSGQSALAGALIGYTALTGKPKFRQAADRESHTERDRICQGLGGQQQANRDTGEIQVNFSNVNP